MNGASNQSYNERDLIEGCIRGDRKMQRELYERFAPKMYGVCLRYAGNAEEAEDILQEGFIKVFRKISSYRGEGSFEGWIRRIFVNTAIEYYRKKTYLQPITEHEENTVEGKYLSVLDNLAEKDIIKLVQQLSPGYRTVFNMYVVEGYTHKQIADLLGISEGTSKSQLSRAKQILQDMVRTYIEKRKQMPEQ
ncbi:MAG TPA: RNA polymerase sigma factor [Flavisolibacter sp.]|nr:RNA polymerase sigma factor [Flavisolibacter sp.]